MTRHDAQPGQRQRGFALLIVLWTLALLALLGTQLVAAGRSDAQLASNLYEAAVLKAATEGAVRRAIFHMLEPLERRWVPDGTTRIVQIGSAVIAIRLEDEGGKINPNIASEELLHALLTQVGAEPAITASLAAAIIDWRTTGTQPRPLGAKAPQYAAAGRDYGPAGANFRSVDELGAVLGMTPALLARLWPHITVFSDTDPDGSTRDPVVRAALSQSGHPTTAAEGNIRAVRGTQVITVIARAKGSGRGMFAERVIIRINAQTNRYPYEILALEQIASGTSAERDL